VQANIPFELLGLLEKLVLHNPEFGQYKKLQNLLIITAIKSDKSKVLDYINRLDNFDGPDIAEYALHDDYRMYEEALAIYRKFDLNSEAVDVLLNRIGNIQRAHEFAEKVNLPEVWTKVANNYLNSNQIVNAIDAYIKANDTSQYLSVISFAENEGQWENLIKYLLMCRSQMKDVNVDSSLGFAYARLEKNGELENLLQSSNSIDPLKVGDRCFDHQLYEAAKLLFVVLKNNAKIASCLVRLKQFSKALESATKANTSKTWKELCYACVEASEFKYAAQAAQNIIIVPDLLEGLSKHYEEYNAQEEMMLLLENALNMPRAH
jgi:clathrin heavy chain